MKKIKKIIIGTHNQGKFKEISNLLPSCIKKISPKELNLSSPEETGSSFRENSKLKAQFFSEKSNLICISDDSGLEIDLLSGAPGIHSSRWAGSNNDFNLAMDKVFAELTKKDPNWIKRKEIIARFICCLTVYWPKGKLIMSEGIIDGNISSTKRGTNGFGYDPIFLPKNYEQTFGEMEKKLKYKIDHRAKAYLKIGKIFN
jgi:XTP/dITP diphosphohydrolase